ncbi:MAG: putative Ig domain-containing protein, partial [Synechococcus sp.]|nr:putative Ig domain-containing protein [Synechococcus sp.]
MTSNFSIGQIRAQLTGSWWSILRMALADPSLAWLQLESSAATDAESGVGEPGLDLARLRRHLSLLSGQSPNLEQWFPELLDPVATQVQAAPAQRPEAETPASYPNGWPTASSSDQRQQQLFAAQVLEQLVRQSQAAAPGPAERWLSSAALLLQTPIAPESVFQGLINTAWDLIQAQAYAGTLVDLIQNSFIPESESQQAVSETLSLGLQLQQLLQTGERLPVHYQLLSDSELLGNGAAFSSLGTTASPTIYLNREWLESRDPSLMVRVLLEEIGHTIDHHLNGNRDSRGDEGELFARQLLGESIDAGTRQQILGQNDAGTITVDGQLVSVEFIHSATTGGTYTESLGAPPDELIVNYKDLFVDVPGPTSSFSTTGVTNPGTFAIEIQNARAGDFITINNDGSNISDTIGNASYNLTVAIPSSLFSSSTLQFGAIQDLGIGAGSGSAELLGGLNTARIRYRVFKPANSTSAFVWFLISADAVVQRNFKDRVASSVAFSSNADSGEDSRVVTVSLYNRYGTSTNFGTATTATAPIATNIVKTLTSESVTINYLNDAPVVNGAPVNASFLEGLSTAAWASSAKPFSGLDIKPGPTVGGVISESGQRITSFTFTVSALAGATLSATSDQIMIGSTVINLNPAGASVSNAAIAGGPITNLAYDSSSADGVVTITVKATGLATTHLTWAQATTLLTGIQYINNNAVNPDKKDLSFALTQVVDAGGTLGGGTPIATISDKTVVVSVVPTNESPQLLTPGLTTNLGTLGYQSINNVGKTIAQMLADGSISDPDLGSSVAPKAIAVRSVNNGSSGTWQYQLAGSTTWTDAVIPAANVLLLTAADSIRFRPNGNIASIGAAVSFSYSAWDQSVWNDPFNNAAPDTRVQSISTLGSTADALPSGTTLANYSPISSNTGTATLNIGVNQDPVATFSQTLTAAEDDASLSFQLTATDPDSDPVTYSLVGSAIAGLTTNSNGSWSFDPGASAYQSLDAGVVSTITVPYTVADGNGGSASGSFVISITGANDVPTLALAIADQGTAEDAAFSFTLPAGTFADVDASDTLSLTATLADGSPLPAWLSFDAITGNFSGTPLNADVGTLSIVVTATDGSSTSISDTFDLTVANVNDPPTLGAPIPDQNATEDGPFSFTLPAGTFVDPDGGDTLNHTATLADGTPLPAWLSFDASTGSFSGTPLNGDVGTISILVTATDGSGTSISDTFALTVANVNDPPTLGAPIPDQNATE